MTAEILAFRIKHPPRKIADAEPIGARMGVQTELGTIWSSLVDWRGTLLTRVEMPDGRKLHYEGELSFEECRLAAETHGSRK